MDHIDGFLGGVLGRIKKNFVFKTKMFILIKEIYGDILEEKDFEYEDGKLSFFLRPILKQEIKYKEEELRTKINSELHITLSSIQYYSPKNKTPQ